MPGQGLDAEALFKSIESEVARGLVFLVEHCAGDQHAYGPWTLFRPPLSMGDARVTTNTLLAEARACAAQYQQHAVRISAQDTRGGGRKVSFIVHLPEASA